MQWLAGRGVGSAGNAAEQNTGGCKASGYHAQPP